MMTYIVVARQIGPPRFLRSSRSLLPKCSSAERRAGGAARDHAVEVRVDVELGTARALVRRL